MQNRPSDRMKRQATDPRPEARTGTLAPTRRIDCGVATDDGAPHTPPIRAERADARHAYVTTRGTYAEQVQAV